MFPIWFITYWSVAALLGLTGNAIHYLVIRPKLRRSGAPLAPGWFNLPYEDLRHYRNLMLGEHKPLFWWRCFIAISVAVPIWVFGGFLLFLCMSQ